MPRPKRECLNNVEYHYRLRGNNQRIIFYDTEDRMYLLRLLEKYGARYEMTYLSYALMDNHIHIQLVDTNDEDCRIPQWAQMIAQCYATYFNRKYNSSGKVFERRYQLKPVESDSYSLQLKMYIEANPLKHLSDEQIQNASAFWTSYGKNEIFSYPIKSPLGLCMLGDKPEVRYRVYQELFRTYSRLLTKVPIHDYPLRVYPIRPNGFSAE